MTGRGRGGVARLKEDDPELIAYRRTTRQSALCSARSHEHAEVMNTIMKIISFLRASSSCQHGMLRQVLMIFSNNVRWLSKRQGSGVVLVHQEGGYSFLDRDEKSEGNIVFSLFKR